MAIACSTSAFKQPLEAALGRVAGMGFQEVDVLAIGAWPHVDASRLAEQFEAERERVSAALEAAGLTPIAMNFAVGHLHRRDDAEANARRLEQVEALTRLMRELGVEVASFYPGYRADDRPWPDVLRDEVTTIREMLEIAERAGVTLTVEPHFNTPFQTIEQVSGLLEALPELRIAYDPSHFAMQGLTLEQVESLLDRAAHVHLRDAAPQKLQAPFGSGTVDFEGLLAALRRRGYAGHFSIEYLPGLEGGAEASITALRDAVSAYAA